MAPVDALGIIAAALVTVYVTAIAAHPTMTATRKRIIAALMATTLGVLSAIITGAIDGIPADVTAWTARLLVTIAAVVIASQGFYQAFKGHLKIVEEATTAPKRAIEE